MTITNVFLGETMGICARKCGWAPWVFLGLASAVAMPAARAATDDPFFDLELKEVLNLEITSVSKKPQTVSQAAAAVFVITADDIRRSGATALPDVLRMAPGIHVGQISANSWAVSSRGPSGRFTNKLLVLMDGRSVYTPMFSGVFWDVQDTVLADIERIEIIRGPGASLWGANAVDGVINIISKSAAATQGGMLTAGAGNEERGFGSLRYGGKVGDVGYWRAYAKGFDRDGSLLATDHAAGNDNWRQQRAGFRTDLAPSGIDSVTFQGDVYAGRSGENSQLNFLTPPFNAIVGTSQKVSGGNMLGRWQREVSASDSFTLQSYIDHTERDWPAHLNEKRTTFDLDFQYRTRRFQNHDLVFGVGYRTSHDMTKASYTGVPANALQFATLHPGSASRKLLSAFVQDDVTLLPEKLTLTLGTKFEHNDYTGLEIQPNARLLWTPVADTTLWGSIARAVRTPSRVDRGGAANQAVFPPASENNPLPLPILVQAKANVDSESVVAYEMGWKQRLTPTLSVDAAVYYNNYDKLRTAKINTTLCQPAGIPVSLACFFPVPQSYVQQIAFAGNDAKASSHGVELSVDWRPRSDLRFQASASQFTMRMSEKGEAFATDLKGSVPEFRGSLRMAWNPRPDTDVDLWLRRVGHLPNVVESSRLSVPGYTELDLRLAWRPVKTVELAIIGRNLLHKQHQELISEILDMPPMLVQRSIFGQVNWKF